ncbi:MAG TPA: MobF family relaxase [Phycisphaerae bacterium]|nr:MobF family relaxase [Phycisphaerae bacterium]
MLRIIQNTTPQGARTYYSTADYYSEGQELTGHWRGEGAKRLGLEGTVQQKDWDALCDNRDPNTGKVLTARQNQGRRVGYDFNFHVPKSVSVLYGVSKDDRILEAFRESVDATMRDMEAEMQTRVRAKGQNDDRLTGNMVWGEFIHTTARPVDGVPDPHLHAHAFVFNTTWDEKEGRWKAAQFAGLKRDAPYFEAVFHSRLARKLEELGLPVERTKKGWELAGVPKPAMEKFSRRTALIEGKAREKGITSAEVKGELGAKTRERKRKDLTFDELRREWNGRLSSEELAALESVKGRLGRASIAEDDRLAGEAVARAVEHSFERSSVVPERRLLAAALKRSYGAASPETVLREVGRQNLVGAERDGRRLVTTADVLKEETRMIDFARRGRGTCRRLGDGSHVFKRDWLNSDQRSAVLHVLNSPDRVMLIRGGAGTGKTTMMTEAVEAIEAHGKHVFTFAPSADASRGVLRREGFADAETVARLLVDQELQSRARGQVLWIDEAGLLGTKTMAQVFDLAERLDARVILSGDRRQHGSVERGAALRLLEEEAGLVPAEVREIQRQKGAYKQAVQALSEGRTEEGFRQLDRLGWVREVTETDRYKALAEDYVATVAEGKTAIVVSPTHREGEWITDEIRSQLKRAGRLSGGEHHVLTLLNANLTEAERSDSLNYSPGDVLVMHQNAKGYRKGERVVVGSDQLPLVEAARFTVYRPDLLPVAPGDVLRITRNGTTADGGHRLNNGATFAVKDFDAKGNIVLTNGWKIARDFGHIAYGYVVTSHASQGRTVDRVLIGESAQSFPAASREQFYVSVSRGRQRATIYTDDKQALLEAVSRSDDRLSATEFLNGRNHRERALAFERLEQLLPAVSDAHRDAQLEQRRMDHDR